nr:MAG TPA: hypothetical protein [Caudoviricetes sp.]
MRIKIKKAHFDSLVCKYFAFLFFRMIRHE